MRSAIAQLGFLIKAFREARGLTQSELVDNLQVTTNRTVIAHLEQGLRLPQPHVLREIGIFLKIPEELWSSFESDKIKPGVDLEVGSGIGVFMPRTIAVSGIMGSGKTTLAKQLGKAFGYLYIAESKRSTQYLKDLFDNPERWAFEVQTAFLFNKANEIISGIKKGYGLIIDRTLTEDASIFAKHFYLEGDIDKRSYELYISLADYFIKTTQNPDIVIFCECSIDIALNRIKKRDRGDESNHSREHLDKIDNLYKEWINNYTESTICTIDSEKWDWRDPVVLHQITREIENLFHDTSNTDRQLTLFYDAEENPEASKKQKNGFEKILNTKYRAPESYSHDKEINFVDKIYLNTQPFPSAYIAAPFTGIADEPDDDISELFRRPHGTIKRGRFKEALLSIEKYLQDYGIASLIPHRDVNEWGKLILNPEQVTAMCTEHVIQTELFVGILGNSHGSHYEFGIAMGMGKPCIIIHCEELGESFIAEGIVNNDSSILSISCKKISAIKERIKENDVENFIKRYFT